MDFHVLYEQICISELKAQERQSVLNEVKNDISNVQKEIRETQASGVLLKSQLAQKLNSLATEEENVLWFSRRQETLQEKLECIRKQKVEHYDQLVFLQESNRKERSKFISEVTAFSKSYDLGGKGQKERQADAKKYLNDLEKQQQQLGTDIAMLGKQQATITKEEDKKMGLQKEIEQLKAKLKSLEENHNKQKSKTKRLELAKTQVSNLPNTDREFQRLRAELESCQDGTMQGVCQALQQELDRLQCQRWQQQVQWRQHPQQAHNKNVASLRTYQSSSSGHSKQASSINRPPLIDQPFRVNTSSATNVQQPASGGVIQSNQTPAKGGVGKFKPNLARLRRSMEQQNNNHVQQNQHPTSTDSTPPSAKQAKKVRFENVNWK